MIQITNKGKVWWLLKDHKPVGFASTYQIALAKVRELEGVSYDLQQPICVR